MVGSQLEKPEALGVNLMEEILVHEEGTPESDTAAEKKKTNLFWEICAVAAVFLLVIAFSMHQDSEESHIQPENQPQLSIQTQQDVETVPPTEPSQTILVPPYDEEVLLCAPFSKEVFDHQKTVSATYKEGNPYRPFVFNCHLQTDGVLRLSEDDTFSSFLEFPLEAGDNAVTIDNLKTGTTYYYQVTTDDAEKSGTIRTARSNRFLSIPGVKNARDIGGYTTRDGKTVKQGLLIRGTEMDGLVEPKYYLPADAIEQMQETFGFVYDMDLRRSSIHKGAYRTRMGSDVLHRFYGSPQYDQIFTKAYRSRLRSIFKDLADPDNYPMYLHCTYGKDRTGTVIFLLQGVLNMSGKDMMLEYELSAYVYPTIIEEAKMNSVIRRLNTYRGDTLQERIITYLTTAVGVTQEEIESIRNIFL